MSIENALYKFITITIPIAETPDLNPIKNLWQELKHFLHVVAKPMNMEELIKGIHRFWDIVTPEKCKQYKGYLNKVLPPIFIQGLFIKLLCATWVNFFKQKKLFRHALASNLIEKMISQILLDTNIY